MFYNFILSFCDFRSFKLRLKRDTSIFADNLDVEEPFDPNKMYKGHAEGEVAELFDSEQYL